MKKSFWAPGKKVKLAFVQRAGAINVVTKKMYTVEKEYPTYVLFYQLVGPDLTKVRECFLKADLLHMMTKA